MILKDENFLKAILAGEKIKPNPEYISVLVPEVEGKVLTLLKEAKKMMKHSKRRYLKTTDIDLALAKLETGHMGNAFGTSQYEYQSRIVEGEAQMVLVNKEVDLEKVVGQPIKETPLDTKVEFYWAQLGGKTPAVPQNYPPVRMDPA